MASQTHRTPISFLQEYCAKKAITPVYNLLSNEGPIHEPLYVVECVAGPYKTIGKGSSKKKAKHLASYLLLMKMFRNNDLVERECATLQELYYGAAAALGPNFLENVDNLDLLPDNLVETEENYVGLLQELCFKRLWPPPAYEIMDEAKMYKCHIQLWKWSLTGHGVSKKAAKKHAAKLMYDDIMDNNLFIPKEALDALDESSLLQTIENKNEDDPATTEGKSKKEEEAASKLAKKALNGLWSSTNVKFKQICIQQPTDTSPCEVLDQVLASYKLQALYTYSNSHQNQVICLIQLPTKPTQVLISRPQSTIDLARESAAKRAIVYLNAMSQKYPSVEQEDWFSV